ncbi:MAG: hypothetical protein WAN43_02950 [Rhodomicrobium sp.]
MQNDVAGGAEVYYVPTSDAEDGRYVSVRNLDRELSSGAGLPVLALKVSREGRIAQGLHGSYWISQEAYEAQKSLALLSRDTAYEPQAPSYSGVFARLRGLFGSGIKGGLAHDAPAPQH